MSKWIVAAALVAVATIGSPGRVIAGPREDAEAAWAKMDDARQNTLVWIDNVTGARESAGYFMYFGKRPVTTVYADNSAAIDAALNAQDDYDLFWALYGVNANWVDGEDWAGGGNECAYDALAALATGDDFFDAGDYASAKSWYQTAEGRFNSASGWYYDSYVFFSDCYVSGMTSDGLLTKAGF